jgi:hypothetical protein
VHRARVSVAFATERVLKITSTTSAALVGTARR